MVLSTLLYGSSSWEILPVELQRLDVVYTKMRCRALKIPRYAATGTYNHTSLLEIYGESLQPSCLIKLRKVKLVGHMLRHDTLWRDFHVLTQDTAPNRHVNANTSRLTNFVAAELRVEKSDLFRLAQSRDHFGTIADDYKAKLQGHQKYIPFNSRVDTPENKRWRKARASCNTYRDFQFVEEGSEPFPLFAHFMHAYTDGSCEELAYGGYGIVYRHALLHVPANFVRRLTLPLRDSHPPTNNRAEISACIDSVLHAPCNTPLAIHTDSGLVWDWFHWGRIVHRRDHYRSLENSDLWRRLDHVITAHERSACVLMIKVRAHKGNPWNEEADSLAFFGSALAVILASRTDELLD